MDEAPKIIMTEEQGDLLEEGCKALVAANNAFDKLQISLRDSNNNHNRKIINKALLRLSRFVNGKKGLLKLFEGLK